MKRRLLAIAAFACISVFAFADTSDDLVESYMKSQNIPGLSLTVVKDGKVVKQSSYGYANLETKTKVGKNTVFEIGSVTKQFTVSAVLKYVEEGKMSLDDPISKYLDDVPEEAQNITIRQCLNHTSGIRDYLGLGFNIRSDYSESALVKEVWKTPLDYAPGETWMYSNGGYVIAALCMQKVSEEKWTNTIQREFFDRFGMKDSYFQNVRQVIPQRADGYVWLGTQQTNSEILRPSAGHAAGAILSTGPDMAKWAKALLRGEVNNPTVFKQALTPANLNSGRKFDYGLGWFLGKVGGHKAYHHGGNSFGQSAQITVVPGEKFAVIALSNAAGKSLVGLCDRVALNFIEDKSEPAPKYSEKRDPNREREAMVYAAFENFLGKDLNPEFWDREAIAMFNTGRGESARAQVRSGIGPISFIRLLHEEKKGDDTQVIYQAYTKSKIARLSLLISSDNKIVRMSAGVIGTIPKKEEKIDSSDE